MDEASDTSRAVSLGQLVLDLRRHALRRQDGAPVEVRPQSLELLCYLAAREGKVVSKSELIEQLWPAIVVTEDSLVQAVSDARRAIADERHDIIQTVPRRGYRLVPASPMETEDRHAEPNPAAPKRGRVHGWLRFGALSVAVAGSLAAWQPWRSSATASSQMAPDRPPMAVMVPVDPTASSEDRALSLAYAYELVGELSRNADLINI